MLPQILLCWLHALEVIIQYFNFLNIFDVGCKAFFTLPSSEIVYPRKLQTIKSWHFSSFIRKLDIWSIKPHVKFYLCIQNYTFYNILIRHVFNCISCTCRLRMFIMSKFLYLHSKFLSQELISDIFGMPSSFVIDSLSFLEVFIPCTV